MVERARQFPGQEQQVWEYYRNNPQALASLRAPIFEEKVVDFLLELTKVDRKEGLARGALQGRRGRATRPAEMAAALCRTRNLSDGPAECAAREAEPSTAGAFPRDFVLRAREPR